MIKQFIFFGLYVPLLFSQNIQWQHFDADIFERAQKDKKPVILHLAANWCHWCHVMEEKTYHHPGVVKYINQNFIAATEDHDKRPDLANKYRDYGWPATIIFSPDGKELFKEAGYIEANEYLGILKKIKSGKLKAIENKTITNKAGENTASLQKNFNQIKKDVFENIDLKVGGFSSEQKSLDFEMFEYAFNHNDNDTLKKWLDVSLKNSLDLMDKEWGGVFQYSTYRDWKHPHYEKLLSVQARYIKMYLWYYYLTADSVYLKAALKNYNYISRFFKKKNNTFSNAQDADLIKGQKATDYFLLSDNERIKQGIPAIDTNTFTDNNSKMIESLIYLYAYTGQKSFLDEANAATQYILNNRKRTDNFFNHAYQQDVFPALADQIYFAKALFLLYRTLGNELYLQTAKNLLDNIVQYFFNGRCMYSFLPVSGYLSPDCIVSENIETARILNMYGKIFHQTKWIKTAESIRNYLLSDEVYSKIIIEPGILSLKEETDEEPYTGLYIVHNLNTKDYNIHRLLLQVPKFYFFNYLMTQYNILKEKEEIYNAFDENTVIFCTSAFCSSPISHQEDLIKFINTKIIRR